MTKKGVDIGEETQIVSKSNEKDDVALPQKDKASKKIAVSGADKNKKEVQREKSIEERVKSLLKKNQNNAIQALFIAIETNDKKVASYLIKHGVNVDEVLYIATESFRFLFI